MVSTSHPQKGRWRPTTRRYQMFLSSPGLGLHGARSRRSAPGATAAAAQVRTSRAIQVTALPMAITIRTVVYQALIPDIVARLESRARSSAFQHSGWVEVRSSHHPGAHPGPSGDDWLQQSGSGPGPGDGVSLAPGIEPADEGGCIKPEGPEMRRRTGARCFVWSGAVSNNWLRARLQRCPHADLVGWHSDAAGNSIVAPARG